MQRAPPCQSLTSDERPATQAHSSSPTFLRDYRPSCHLSPLICQFNLISLVLFQALSSSRPSFSTSSCQKLINHEFSLSAGPPLKSVVFLAGPHRIRSGRCKREYVVFTNIVLCWSAIFLRCGRAGTRPPAKGVGF